MAKYNIGRGFSFDGKKQRTKGQVVELSGDELKFAQENRCIAKPIEKKEK